MRHSLLTFVLSLGLVSCTQPKTDQVASSIENFKSGYAPINSINMYYEIHGDGPPLVLIHGGGSTIETTFGNILSSLATHRKVIAADLQAHGRTSDRDAGGTFEQDADDVAALLSYLKIEKADFFGFSNGATTSTQIALRHPEIVDRLVLASGIYKREGMIKGFFEGIEHASLENMPQPLKDAYLKVAPDKSHLRVMHDKDRDRMRQFKDWQDDDLKSIKAPTLIIAGDHDVVTPEHAVQMSHLIPNAQLLIVPGNHGSFIGEVCSVQPGSKIPEMTVAVVEEFLNGQKGNSN